MLTIYKPPKLRDQFDFEREVSKHINETEAINIDGLDVWHIEKIISYTVFSGAKHINFCSKKEGRLFAIALKFRYRLLWFVNTGSRYKPIETIAGINFLSLSRL